MTEVLSNQSSVVSGQTRDSLADAHCPHCGYSLRGLPENRCPECGNAFDPAAVLTTFRPKWPDLMKWLLLGYVISGVLTSPFLISSLLSLKATPAARSFAMVTTLPHLVRELIFVALGLIAALGLHRRRDWGRGIGLAVFAAVCLSFILPVPLSTAFGNPIGSFRRSDILLYWLSQWLEALPLCLIGVFLATGLRRRCLARRSDETAPLLSCTQFSPRKDWLLLMSVIFVNMGLLEAFIAAGCGSIFHYARTQVYPGNVSTICLAATLITAISALWLWLSAVLQWRRPHIVRALVIVNLVVLAMGLAAREVANHLIWASPNPLAALSVYAVIAVLPSLLPLLSLLVFVFRDLTDGDVQLVSMLKRR